MAGWVETYRGAAAPWECDVTEHFTLAFYLDRIAQAEANVAEQLGLIDALRAGGFARRYDVRLVRELHAGSAFHIESAAIGPRESGFGDEARMGHRVIDTVSGEVTTWFDVSWQGVAMTSPVERARWEAPSLAVRPEPQDLSGLVPSMAGRVDPGDLDEFGRLGIAGIVHKFSDAAVQFGGAIGLTADYIASARRSFSAFGLRLAIAREPKLGEAYRIDTGLAGLGTTSLRYLHLMREMASGAEIARMDRYGVQLDLDARRPAPLAPALRERAEQLLMT